MDKPEDRKKKSVIVIDQSIEKLATAVVDFLERDAHFSSDPFDDYARTKRCKLYLDLHSFKQRFMHGYEVLLRELNQQENQ